LALCDRLGVSFEGKHLQLFEGEKDTASISSERIVRISVAIHARKDIVSTCAYWWPFVAAITAVSLLLEPVVFFDA